MIIHCIDVMADNVRNAHSRLRYLLQTDDVPYNSRVGSELRQLMGSLQDAVDLLDGKEEESIDE